MTPPVDETTITDMDGNVYTTVKIGNQLWTVENWKSTKYNDGTPIPLIADHSEWESNTTGAMCYYNNNEANKDIYGALYNWYATDKLAPDGWSVPTDEDWTVLEEYLIANGYNYDDTTEGNKIGKAMADVDNVAAPWCVVWITEVVGNYVSCPEKNNLSKFSALAGGYRSADVRIDFNSASYHTYWWSSTQSGETSWYRHLGSYYSNLSRFDDMLNRDCVKMFNLY